MSDTRTTVIIHCSAALADLLGAAPSTYEELKLRSPKTGAGHRYFQIVPLEKSGYLRKWAVVHPDNGTEFIYP